MLALKITLTTAGRAAYKNAQGDGTNAITLGSVGITAASFDTTPGITVLPSEIKRLATIAGGATAADTLHITIKDTTSDSYSLRGIGLYLADGTLFGVFSQPGVLVEKSAQASLVLATDVQFADIDAAQIILGDTNFNLNQATTETVGLIELATDVETITGNDAQRAITPKSLLAALNDRLGAASPSAFVKTILGKVSALAFVTALGIRGAASYDTGAGNGLDADKLDGQHGAYYLDWANQTGVPQSFPPSAHQHAWGDISNPPATATRWPSFGEVTGKPATYAPSPHSHVISDVIGLQSAIDAKFNRSGGQITGSLDIAVGTPSLTFEDINVSYGRIVNSDSTLFVEGANQVILRGYAGSALSSASVKLKNATLRFIQVSNNTIAIQAVNPGETNFGPMNISASFVNFDKGSIAVNGDISGNAANLSSLAASGAITGATIRSTGTITAAGGFQIG